jgi:hypothetical protein
VAGSLLGEPAEQLLTTPSGCEVARRYLLRTARLLVLEFLGEAVQARKPPARAASPTARISTLLCT